MTSPTSVDAPFGTSCYRHPSRETAVRCSNCDRPICPDCMRATPVGFRCPECAPKSKAALAEDLLVTKAIIAANIIVFVVGIVLQNAGGFQINGVSAGNELVANGALATDLVAQGDWWRLFTSGFLHAGLLHVGLNMFFVWSFGGLLEPALGRLRFGLLYLVGILGGSVGAMLLSSPNVYTVGASGAAFALLGAALVMARLRGLRDLESNLLSLAGINFLITFIVPGISAGGHLGGFIVGGIAGYLIYGPAARKPATGSAILGGMAVGLFAVALVVASALATTTFTAIQ